MNRRSLLLAAPLLLVPQLVVAQALPKADQPAIIAAVARAVNAITRLQGRFIQTNPDGTNVGGRYWLQRPGKVRFEYDAPSPLVLISDGTNVILRDKRLRTTDRYPLRQTPLYFLLKANVDLVRDVIVTGVERRGGNHFVAMRDRRREALDQSRRAQAKPKPKVSHAHATHRFFLSWCRLLLSSCYFVPKKSAVELGLVGEKAKASLYLPHPEECSADHDFFPFLLSRKPSQ